MQTAKLLHNRKQLFYKCSIAQLPRHWVRLAFHVKSTPCGYASGKSGNWCGRPGSISLRAMSSDLASLTPPVSSTVNLLVKTTWTVCYWRENWINRVFSIPSLLHSMVFFLLFLLSFFFFFIPQLATESLPLMCPA